MKFTRLNFFVPVPQVRDMAELNTQLRQRCAEDQQRWLRGQPGTKAQLLAEDQKAFLPLPTAPFEACRKISTTASSLSLVRFDRNDYSVPVRWAHHPIVAKGSCDQVVLCAAGSEVARHPRIWEANKPGVACEKSWLRHTCQLRLTLLSGLANMGLCIGSEIMEGFYSSSLHCSWFFHFCRLGRLWNLVETKRMS